MIEKEKKRNFFTSLFFFFDSNKNSINYNENSTTTNDKKTDNRQNDHIKLSYQFLSHKISPFSFNDNFKPKWLLKRKRIQTTIIVWTKIMTVFFSIPKMPPITIFIKQKLALFKSKENEK